MRNFRRHVAHPEQFIMSLPVIAVPDQMSKATNPPLDHLQSRPVSRVEGIDAPNRLLDVLHSHGDMPPIQNAGDRLPSHGADKAGKGGFTVAEDRDRAAGSPSLLAKRLA